MFKSNAKIIRSSARVTKTTRVTRTTRVRRVPVICNYKEARSYHKKTKEEIKAGVSNAGRSNTKKEINHMIANMATSGSILYLESPACNSTRIFKQEGIPITNLVAITKRKLEAECIKDVYPELTVYITMFQKFVKKKVPFPFNIVWYDGCGTFSDAKDKDNLSFVDDLFKNGHLARGSIIALTFSLYRDRVEPEFLHYKDPTYIASWFKDIITANGYNDASFYFKKYKNTDGITNYGATMFFMYAKLL